VDCHAGGVVRVLSGTGGQTCARPVCGPDAVTDDQVAADGGVGAGGVDDQHAVVDGGGAGVGVVGVVGQRAAAVLDDAKGPLNGEIGRASCRERGDIAGDGAGFHAEVT